MTNRPRVWLITGCATGFGAILAQKVLDRGDYLAATDRDLASLDHLKCDEPDRLFTCKLDVTDINSVRLAVDAALARFDYIHVLVNNAGLGLGGPFEEAEWDDVRRLMMVNAMGVMAVTQAVLPAMRKQQRGRIINVSSDSGIFGQPMQAAYSASKYAVEGFSEALSHEVAKLGIRIALVEPCGMFKTQMPANAMAEAKARLSHDSPYRPLVENILAKAMASMDQAQDPALVADTILRVADETSPPLRNPIGPTERMALIAARQQMPDESFVQLVRQNL